MRELDYRTVEIDCDRCGESCVDFRQRNGERVCIGCVSEEGDSAASRLAHLEAEVARLRGALMHVADNGCEYDGRACAGTRFSCNPCFARAALDGKENAGGR